MHSRYIQYWRVHFLLLFFTHIFCLCHLLDVKPYASLLIFLFSGPIAGVIRPLQEWSRVSYKRDCPGVNPFVELPAIEFGFEKSSCFPKITFFSFFFHLHLIGGVCFQYSQYASFSPNVLNFS